MIKQSTVTKYVSTRRLNPTKRELSQILRIYGVYAFHKVRREEL